MISKNDCIQQDSIRFNYNGICYTASDIFNLLDQNRLDIQSLNTRTINVVNQVNVNINSGIRIEYKRNTNQTPQTTIVNNKNRVVIIN